MTLKTSIEHHNETVLLIKAQFEKYDTILKQIGYELCEVHKQTQIIKARLNKLEEQHLIGSEHMIKRDKHIILQSIYLAQ